MMETLTLKTKLAYALPAFSMAVVGIPIYIYIPKFYTDVMGLDIAVVGSLLLFLRMFDAITDPMMGLISDRTATPFGRRRPYIAVGAFCMGGSILFLFNPPAMTVPATTGWFFVWMAAVFIFWTVTVVPYESLGPELTFDYDERTGLFGLRDGFLIAGTMVAATIPVGIRYLLDHVHPHYDDRTVFLIMSVLYGPLILFGSLVCFFVVKETTVQKKTDSWNLAKGLKTTLENTPFLILICSFTFGSVAAQMPATLILYYVQYVLHSSRAELFLLIYFISGIAFLPAWVRLSGHIGKKKAWMISMAINTGAFFFVFWLGPGDELYYGILVFLSGIGFGAGLALPSALTADVIDYDQMLSGKRREGEYIGIFSVAKKMSAAAGAGISLWVLGIAGYVPNTAQSSDVLLAMRTLYALVPCFLNVLGLVIAGFYPLSKARHDQLLSMLDQENPKPDHSQRNFHK